MWVSILPDRFPALYGAAALHLTKMAISLNPEQRKILSSLGFTENPFTLWPDTRFLYLAKPHLRVLEKIIASLEQKEIIVVIGESGTGKTLLSTRLNQLLSIESRFRVARLNFSQVKTHNEFLLSIREAFELPGHKIARNLGSTKYQRQILPVDEKKNAY